MNLLRIILFGCPRIYCCEGDQEVRLTRNVQLLLAYLVLERNRAHSRELLAGLFWRDQSQEKARACLNTALWRLRSALEASIHPSVPFFVNHQTGEIRFNLQSSYSLDVEIFEQCIEDLRFAHSKDPIPDQLKIAEKAEQLYNGELMEGYYENWVVSERERLRSRYLRVLAFLMSNYHRAGNLDQSLYYGQKLLQLEPLREEIYREMMRIYAQAGYRTQALELFESCRQMLQNELNIEPMPETQQLCHQILYGPTQYSEEKVLMPAEKKSFPTESDSIAERINSVRKKVNDQINDPQNSLRPEQYALLHQALDKLDQAVELADTMNRQILDAIDDIGELINQK